MEETRLVGAVLHRENPERLRSLLERQRSVFEFPRFTAQEAGLSRLGNASVDAVPGDDSVLPREAATVQ